MNGCGMTCSLVFINPGAGCTGVADCELRGVSADAPPGLLRVPGGGEG